MGKERDVLLQESSDDAVHIAKPRKGKELMPTTSIIVAEKLRLWTFPIIDMAL